MSCNYARAHKMSSTAMDGGCKIWQIARGALMNRIPITPVVAVAKCRACAPLRRRIFGGGGIIPETKQHGA